MGLFDFWRRPAPAKAARARAFRPGRSMIPPSGDFTKAYLFASTDRLVADFPTFGRSANADIRAALVAMRARGRHLAQNNDYAKGYLRALRRNVVGAEGIRLQGAIRNPADRSIDSFANMIVEEAFARWCMPANCTVNGRVSFAQLQRILITLVCRDGEALIRHVRNADNPFAYAVQIMPIELLDETLNVPRGQGFAGVEKGLDTDIRMGVERDAGGRPVAYHLRTWYPGDDLLQATMGSVRMRQRVPAEDLVHLFREEDADQARGVTELHTAARRLQMLSGYEEAELTAARAAANKMGFYHRADAETDAADLADEQEGDSEDNPGEFIDNAEPGTFPVLPRGYQFQPFDPQHPTQAFPEFVRQMLRGAGAGAGLSYATFANDLTQASYGSLRVGALEDRDEWRTWQNWFAASALQPIFETWIGFAMTAGALEPLRADRLDKYKSIVWRGRGFSWIDPEKEARADQMAVDMRIKSRTELCAERGRDFEDVLREQQEEQRLAAKYGITLPAATAASAAPPADPKQEE